jgi:hypothetical protein
LGSTIGAGISITGVLVGGCGKTVLTFSTEVGWIGPFVSGISLCKASGMTALTLSTEVGGSDVFVTGFFLSESFDKTALAFSTAGAGIGAFATALSLSESSPPRANRTLPLGVLVSVGSVGIFASIYALTEVFANWIPPSKFSTRWRFSGGCDELPGEDMGRFGEDAAGVITGSEEIIWWRRLEVGRFIERGDTGRGLGEGEK